MRSNVSSGKWRPFCLGLNVLSDIAIIPGAGTQFMTAHIVIIQETIYHTRGPQEV